MRWLSLALRLMVRRPLATLMQLGVLALAWATVAFVLLVGEQIEARVQRDLAGIDLVVGAKGSPMQLMLAGVFHLDSPSGNIPFASVERLRAQPLVAQVLPLSLGDSLAGWRIVGSTPEYLTLYGGRLQQGQMWQAPMQVVLGADVAKAQGLRVGDRFMASHGLAQSGPAHGDSSYAVVGILAPSGSVLDRLVLTDLRSVWELHEEHGDHEDHGDETERAQQTESAREVSLLLVRYRSPLGAAMLPRWVNAQTDLQAAAPALESARLLRMLGVGREVLQGLGALLLVSALLTVFVALLALVRERQGDLALLRMLGAGPWRLALLVAAQAVALVLAALLLGLAMAHGGLALLAHALNEARSLQLDALYVCAHELWLLPLAAGMALLAAAGPAWVALRADVGLLLQAPR
ncbi:putative ABC transport system permease protein [Inhella inkyongensis]|uniref:Putative ABC transport system permease protein n=1 Tax=Inhella inkyongensis TaxID=392593 RepID=A0A840S396_9BURK|nr:ABC transporter permease [Inhella inkyongensis]MBB5204203.1 putative ABC transport system permease protein [Inhella inkyongensis]